MPITDVMTAEVVCVVEDFTVETLEQLLIERVLSGVPVVNNDGKLVGWAAMTDIVRYFCERGGDGASWGPDAEMPSITVSQIMTPIAVELQSTSTVSRAMELMTTQHVHRAPVVSDGGELVGVVTTGDILRHLARERRRGRGDALTRAESDRLATLGYLAASVAHEVNNALVSTRVGLGRLTSFELARRPLDAERLHRIELLQDVREGIARIERVAHQLRSLAYADDGPPGPVSITQVVEDATALAEREIKHRARLVCELSATTAPVRARLGELKLAVLALLLNAVQALPEGEPDRRVLRVSTFLDARGRAIIEISDTGTGIAPEVLPRIFEPLFTTRAHSTGLGLGMVRDIIAAYDGELAVDTVVGKGTTVRIALPTCEETAPIAVASASVRPQDDRRRILLVDDDRPVAAAIALELGAHDVVVASSGREALEIIRRDKAFDVILCDLMMPEVSGMDVYDALAATDGELLDRVVLMTGGAFTPRAREFLSRVRAPILEKPFAIGELEATIRRTAPNRTGDVPPTNAWTARRNDHAEHES